MHKHATDLENRLADYNRRQPRQRKYTFTDTAIDKSIQLANPGIVRTIH